MSVGPLPKNLSNSVAKDGRGGSYSTNRHNNHAETVRWASPVKTAAGIGDALNL